MLPDKWYILYSEVPKNKRKWISAWFRKQAANHDWDYEIMGFDGKEEKNNWANGYNADNNINHRHFQYHTKITPQQLINHILGIEKTTYFIY